jgi:hypothetical protein
VNSRFKIFTQAAVLCLGLGVCPAQADSQNVDWAHVGSCSPTSIVSTLLGAPLSGIEILRSKTVPGEFKLNFGFVVVMSRFPQIPASGRTRELKANLDYLVEGVEERSRLIGPELLDFRSVSTGVPLSAALQPTVPPTSEGSPTSSNRSFDAHFTVRPGTAIFHDLLDAGGIDSSGSGTVTCQGEDN